MRKVIWMIIVCGITFSATCQDFKEFYSLRGKADSAYEAKNYPLSIDYYNQLLNLSDSQKPEIVGLLYYEIACVFSLNKDKEKAIYFLEKSFVVNNAKENTNPVLAEEITGVSIPWDGNIRDSRDLDFIRQEIRYRNILKKYYRDAPIELLEAKEISYEELLIIMGYIKKANSLKRGQQLFINGKTIYWKKHNGTYDYNKESLSKLTDFSENALMFRNCSFKLNLQLSDIQDVAFFAFYFDQCIFEGNFHIDYVKFIHPLGFEDVSFNKNLFLFSATFEPENANENFIMVRSKFSYSYVSVESTRSLNFSFNGNEGLDSADFFFKAVPEIASCDVHSNDFNKSNFYLSLGNTDRFDCNGNKFNNFSISETSIQTEFVFKNNSLNKNFLAKNFSFTNEPLNSVDFNNLIGNKLAVKLNSYRHPKWDSEQHLERINKIQTIKAILPNDLKSISNGGLFDNLLGLYSMFLNLFKNKNSLENYNACFIEVKELQSQRLKYLYESNKTFESFFRWKLSQLLKFYVRHGTDPARAIVISIYIIFTFGVFFFFFPSDWDVTSKSRLISNFKDFIQKNEKGYIKPFFVLLAGFALSLINALTLSLNAFITLGFGNIPTHGLARYVCVIEGFMGWFLLSIFTVALINQVL